MRRALLPACCMLLGLACLASGQQAGGAGGKKMTAWIKSNNKFGANSKFALQMSEVGQESLEKGNNIMFTFDAGAMKSKQATLVSVFSGELFVFPLSLKQTLQLKIKDGSVDFFENPRPDRTQLPLVAQISDLKIDDASSLSGRKMLSGQFTCQNMQNNADKYAVRLAFRIAPNNQQRFHHLEQPLPNGNGTVRFSFPSLVDKDDPAYVGPLPVYVTLCKVSEIKGKVDIALHSNTLGLLLNVGE